MSTANLVGRSERSNSFQREKKEVYISESAFSQLQSHRKRHLSPTKNSYDTTKPDEGIFMTSNSSNDMDQPNQNLLNKPEKSNQMKRLKIMKTSVFDNDLPALSDRNSMIYQEIEKRFDKNSIFMPAAKDPKWAEFKIIGSNIQSRSRSSICVQGGFLYVYGGYEVKAGQLGDFWRVNLNSEQFIWEQVKSKSKANPDRLSRQSSCVFNDKFYLFGGQNGCLQSNNNLWCFDFKAETWTLIKPNNKINSEHMPSPIDSHSSVLISDRFYVLFGYFADSGTLSNAVYEYSFTNNNWTCLFANNHHYSNNNLPKARFESAVTYLPSKLDSIYAFGGTDGFVRMNDLWEFNLKSKTYLKIIPADPQLPLIRSGHQLFSMNDQIVVLGGIHDITWEVDDLCIFNFSNSKWSIVDADSARRKDSLPKLNVSQGIQDKSQNQNITLPEIRATRSQSYKKTIINGHSSPTKRLMGNPMPSFKIRSGRLTDFGRTAVSRFIQPLKDQLRIRQGKKPCARDGHRIAFYGKDKLLVFGGDRHNMSFNDIYQLDLELLQQKYNDFANK